MAGNPVGYDSLTLGEKKLCLDATSRLLNVSGTPTRFGTTYWIPKVVREYQADPSGRAINRYPVSHQNVP
jgi:hypothetical protein